MRKIIFAMAILFGLVHADIKHEIRAGSESGYRPFAYVDKNGVPTGFDNDALRLVVRYIDARATVKIQPMPWNAIFSSLDSGKVDVIASQIAKTEEREKKYIFSNEPYFYGLSALIVNKNSDANTLQDLKGKKIGVTVGSNHARNLEQFLKEHPDLNISIAYYKNTPPLFADLARGGVAAIINDPIAANDLIKSQNIDIRVTDFYFEKVPIYFIFTNEFLADKFNTALHKAIKDGKIDELIESYFGKEYLEAIKR